jgi:predicted acylesterase/phospholipase RssA/CRP-like cAMP-binding protein
LKPLDLKPSEELVHRGEPAEDLFILLQGRMRVLNPDDPTGERHIAELEAGAVIGELALVVGGSRTATVVAETTCRLVSAPLVDLRRLGEQHPRLLEALSQDTRARLRRSQLARFLARILGTTDSDVLADLEAVAEWITLRGGETLFRQGDEADAAFIVISGRLRISITEQGEERVINEIGRGEPLGELALLSRGRRSATVTAARDTDLARIGQEAFDQLIERYPRVLRQITTFLVDRLRRQSEGHETDTDTLSTLGIVPVGRNLDLAEFAGRLVPVLSRFGRTLALDARRVDRALGKEDISQEHLEATAGIRLSQWLNEQEERFDYLVYLADNSWTPWTERVARQSDHLLLVADSRDDPRPAGLEEMLTAAIGGRVATRCSLVLLHEGEIEGFTGTAGWLARRRLDGHFHVRKGRGADYRRLARSLIGLGVGLVLGGGGARGFAHLGLLQALEEVGVPIDFAGGTSIGAIIATAYPLEVSAVEARRRVKGHFSKIFDPTFPMVSLLAGRRIWKQFQVGYGDRRIEDLPIPYFCISTNLSGAHEQVHSAGPMATAIRSSIALPGILPPVGFEGDVLVDGGLLNNLPTDRMHELNRGGPIIASDVTAADDALAAADLDPHVSGWRLVADRLNPLSKTRLDVNILSVLMRSTVVAGIWARRERREPEQAGLQLNLPMKDYGLLEFESLDAIADHGYDESRNLVAAWWETVRDRIDPGR